MDASQESESMESTHSQDEQRVDSSMQPPHSHRIRVGVIDCNQLECEGLVALLNASAEFVCVGAWSDIAQGVNGVSQLKPQIVLLDARLPGRSSLEILRALHLAAPGSSVVYLVDCQDDVCAIAYLRSYAPQAASSPARARIMAASRRGMLQSEDCLQMALKSGARGVVRKQCSFKHLTQVIGAVAGGQLWMDASTAIRLAEQFLLTLQPSKVTAGAGLTARERQVVELISEGYSNKQMATQLQLAYPTIKNCVSSILRKLALEDRTQIALYAVGKGSSDPPRDSQSFD